MSRKEINGLFVASAIFAFVLTVLLWSKLIDTGQAIQLILTFVLVLVTVAYVKRTADIAKSTKEQAEASLKMAEGMARPVIDFQWQDLNSSVEAGALMEGADGKVPSELHCILCNIGVGHAIDLYTESVKGNREYEFGTLKMGERTPAKRLAVSRRGESGEIKAYYRSIYGSNFKSTLRIFPVQGKGLRTERDFEEVKELLA